MDADDELTVWCGNLPSEIDEEILYELFLQVAPLKKVRIPLNAKTGGGQANFGFVTFKHLASVPYAIDIMHGTKLFDKSIVVRTRNNTNQQSQQQSQMSQSPADLEQLLKMGQQLLVNDGGGGRGRNNFSNNNWRSRNNHNNSYNNDKRENRNFNSYNRNANNSRNSRGGHSRFENNEPYSNFSGRRRH